MITRLQITDIGAKVTPRMASDKWRLTPASLEIEVYTGHNLDWKSVRRATMVRPAFSHALLFAFVSISSALHAQSVSLNVCNAGKLDIDVILSQLGKASSSHIGSADCTTVAETKGSMAPAYIGFAFADSHGQWGAARRLDLLPSLGSDILARANQTTLVRHGNDNVSVAMLPLFKPRVPG
jgi:hypothetical protein